MSSDLVLIPPIRKCHQALMTRVLLPFIMYAKLIESLAL